VDDYVSSGGATAKEIGKETAVGGLGGAATGATVGAVHGTVKSAEPSPIYKGFVDRCLRERGYEVIGWQ
jgi:outer membrane lipoprotein SlyB